MNFLFLFQILVLSDNSTLLEANDVQYHEYTHTSQRYLIRQTDRQIYMEIRYEHIDIAPSLHRIARPFSLLYIHIIMKGGHHSPDEASSMTMMTMIFPNSRPMICKNPSLDSIRVLTLVRNPPSIDLPPIPVFLNLGPLDGQIGRAPDTFRNICEAVLDVLGSDLTGALFLSSGVGPVFEHGVHELPIAFAKGSLFN